MQLIIVGYIRVVSLVTTIVSLFLMLKEPCSHFTTMNLRNNRYLLLLPKVYKNEFKEKQIFASPSTFVDTFYVLCNE